MQKASDIIKRIENHEFDQLINDVYVDRELLTYQRERYIFAIRKYISLFGDEDVTIISVPGRSEVCGNHTDHQHGEVLAAAINLDMIAVVGTSDCVKVRSDGYDIKAIELNDLTFKKEESGTSEALIRGVLARFQQMGLLIGGFRAFITSDVLQGSGLSSSAAFEVMIATILSVLYNHGSVDPVLLAQIGQYSENVYFEKPCGLMDQCACSVGSLIHMDFKNNEQPAVEKIDADFSSYQHSLCIIDVHASHADLTADYAAIPEEMNEVAKYFHQDVLRNVDEKQFFDQIALIRENVSDRALLRAIHFFEENKRVRKMVEALRQNRFDLFQEVVKKSGYSSFQYLQNVYSCHDVRHQAVSLALALSEKILDSHGVCRVHGGGFAGTIQAFVENDYVLTYKERIEEIFGEGSCHILKIRKYGGKVMID